ncbi:MAG TPA: tetratricopeptide repeat protein [Gemmatimonadaceae bacterium]|nr:tetratricopeptide repeat protein [Gemmatimonadaceae bacterium]
MPSRLIAGSLLALSVTGCLATKGDIRLLQDELRATRASVARSDSAHRRTSDSLAAAVASLAAIQASAGRDLRRTNDELKALTARVGSNDLATKEQLKSLNDDIDQLREITRQNMRGAALARAQMEQAAARPPVTTPDTTAAAAPPTAPGTPGPATLLVSGRSMIIQGSCTTARRAFQDVLTLYPSSQEAPEAQYSIAESFISCGEGGNPARADSVYRLVVERYPKSDFAATSLYKRAEMLRSGGKPEDARPLYAKVVCEYPKSTVFAQALDRLGSRPVCK